MIDFKNYNDSHLIIELGGGSPESEQPILKKLANYWNFDRVSKTPTDFDAECWKMFPADSSVDLIYASHVLEHVNKLQRLLNECHRVLKNGAKIYIVVPHKDSEKALAIDHVRLLSEFTFKSLEKEYAQSSFGWLPWKILEMVTNERGDIHVVMTPDK